MKRLILSVAAVSLVGVAAAQQQQKEYPQPEPMRPGHDRVLDPAAQDSNSRAMPPRRRAPSDAIVLFDGKNLDAWVSSNTGGAAEWRVHDGVFTVDKSKGDIQTRENFGSFQLHLEWMVPEGHHGRESGTRQQRCLPAEHVRGADPTQRSTVTSR